MLFGGALELLLVGWATSRPITNLPLMVLDQDQSAASRAVVTALENTGTFALRGPGCTIWRPSRTHSTAGRSTPR